LEPLDDATWRRLRVSALISTKLARRNTVLKRAWGFDRSTTPVPGWGSAERRARLMSSAG